MECTFAGSHLKDFVRALRCLATFGDELNITATTQEFKLSAVSATRSAFGLVSFEPSFFTNYHLDNEFSPSQSTSRQASSPPDAIQISVTARTLLNALGKRATMTTVENVALSIVFDEQIEDELSTECRMVIRLFCKYGVVKTHRLTFAAETALTPLFNRSSCTSHWEVSSFTLDEWINHFSSSKRTGTEEISLLCASTFCKLKSYEPSVDYQSLEGRGRDDLANQAVSTSVHVDTSAFESYNVEGEEVLTFGLKEFKAMIHFGKEAGCPLEADFICGGQPLMASIRGTLFYAEFVLATSGDDPAQVKSEPVPERKANRQRTKEKSASASVQPQEGSKPVSSRFPDADQQSRPSRRPTNDAESKDRRRLQRNELDSSPSPQLPSLSRLNDIPADQQPLFRPSVSPSPRLVGQSKTNPGSEEEEDQQPKEPTVDQDNFEAELDEDFVIPDSEMNEAFEQWSQHQVTQSQRPEPQSPSQREPRPQKFVDTQATADSDDEEEESAARRAKKAKWQLFD